MHQAPRHCTPTLAPSLLQLLLVTDVLQPPSYVLG